MRIGIIGSMQFTEKMIELKKELISIGFDAFVTDLVDPFIGKTDEEKEQIKIQQKHEIDVFKEFWDKMQGADAVLVANFDKKGIKNYIGGNSFLEMGFAHILKQIIYLINPIPEIDFYKSEIVAMHPIILNGDLSKIKQRG